MSTLLRDKIKASIGYHSLGVVEKKAVVSASIVFALMMIILLNIALDMLLPNMIIEDMSSGMYWTRVISLNEGNSTLVVCSYVVSYLSILVFVMLLSIVLKLFSDFNITEKYMYRLSLKYLAISYIISVVFTGLEYVLAMVVDYSSFGESLAGPVKEALVEINFLRLLICVGVWFIIKIAERFLGLYDEIILGSAKDVSEILRNIREMKERSGTNE